MLEDQSQINSQTTANLCHGPSGRGKTGQSTGTNDRSEWHWSPLCPCSATSRVHLVIALSAALPHETRTQWKSGQDAKLWLSVDKAMKNKKVVERVLWAVFEKGNKYRVSVINMYRSTGTSWWSSRKGQEVHAVRCSIDGGLSVG